MYRTCAVAAVALLVLVGAVAGKDCHSKKSSSKLFCYYGKAKDIDSCKCSHIILPADADVKSIEGLRDKLGATKILLTVNEFNEGLINTLKTTKVDGLEINLKKLDSKNDISDFISTVRSKLGSDLYLALSVPPKTETLAKYYDFKSLTKNADVFILQTHLLGVSKNVTFHPSRLSGLWDVQNTDSVVDLVSGLGAPLSKLVITAPVQGFKFTLQNEKHTAPGSPALELSTLTRDQLCEKMGSDKWMLERDQDQAGPYIFRKNEWVSFEDSMSMDIKAKYSRVRGLAGLALKDLSQDGGEKCGETLLESAYSGLSKQARAPRGAVLHSLEREILQTPSKILDNVQVSPYRISRVIDVEGKVHVIRQDTRTEFACSRQGYFVHPRSCGRFYRCVKFDQLSDEFSVFEFDCPAGLAFDERVEVCVWPGSLPHASACSGSSEIAPVPRERFVCPGEQGYYADPENCRWFFACLDHGKSPLSAYEFRCPYGLVFDEERLMCEWPWLVPKCGSGYASGHGDDYYYGGLHNSKGVAVGLDLYDGLGSLNGIKLGGLSGPLVQPIQKTYSSLGTGQDIVANVFGVQPQITLAGAGHRNGFGGSGIYIAGSGNQYGQSKTAGVNIDHSQGYHAGADSARYYSSADGSGSYRHDSSGEGYHAGADSARYHSSSDESGSYRHDNSGDYNVDNSGSYVGDNTNYRGSGADNSGSYKSDGSGSYNGNAGAYYADNSGSYKHKDSSAYVENSGSSVNIDHSGNSGSYNAANSGAYVAVSGENNNGAGSGSISIDHSGQSAGYVSDNSGSYKHDASGSYNAGNSGAYVAVSGVGSGSINVDHSGQSAGYVSDNSGSYKHDASGSYNAGNSGAYVTVSGVGSGSISTDHSGQSAGYVSDNSGSYKHGASGSYNAGNSGGYVAVSGVGTGSISTDHSGQSGSYESGNSGSYKHDASGNYNAGNSGAYVAVSGVGAGSINIDHSGQSGGYVSDNSGSYKHDASGSYKAENAGAYVAVSGENVNGVGTGSISIDHSDNSGSYKHDASGSYNAGNSGAYVAVSEGNQGAGAYVSVSGANTVGSGSTSHNSGYVVDNSGSYKHDESGSYKGENAGGYVAVSGEKQNSGILIGVSDHSNANAGGSGVINIDHSGSYNAGASGSYVSDNSGSYNVGGSSSYVSDNSGSYNAGGSGSYASDNSGSYNAGVSSSYVSDNSGSYKHNSGSYSAGNSGSYVAVSNEKQNVGINVGSGVVNNINSGSYNTGGAYVAVSGGAEKTYSSGHAVSHSYHQSSSSDESGSYKEDNSGQYVEDNSGAYVSDNSGSYNGVNSEDNYHGIDSGKYQSGQSGSSYATYSSGSGSSSRGSVSYQSSNSNSQSGGYKHEQLGQVNIIAGGASGVGVAKGVQLIQHGINLGGVENVTPLTIVSSSIPSVTSVPLPAKSDFEFFNGGVVANIPDLQLKLEHPTTINAYLGNFGTYKEAKAKDLGFANYTHLVSSTQAPLVIKSDVISSGFDIAKVDNYKQVVGENGGYVYDKPSITFEEKRTYLPPVQSTYLPAVSTTPATYLPPVSPTVYLLPSSTPKPTAAVYLPPAPSTYSPPKSYNYGQRTLHKSSYVLPSKPIQGLKFGVVESQSYHNRQKGYQYVKPTISFEEKPKAIVQPAYAYQEIKHDVQPVTIHKQVQPAVTIHQSEGYHYEKPTIAFEEKPVVVEQKTIVQPAVAYQEIKHDVQPVTIHKQVQPAVTIHQSEGYHYEKPTIAFEEKPKAIVQPAVAYQEIKHDVQPVTIHKQVQPAVTIHQSEGYHYEKPTIAFEEKPVVVEHKTIVQPAVTYQEIKHHVQPVQPAVTIHQSEGYHYEKPTITFEEKPKTIVQPAVAYQEIKHDIQPVTIHKQVQPAVTVHQSEGYHYEKPAIKFEEKPVVVEHKTIVQPAVTYQEIKHHAQPIQPAVTIHQSEGYHYDKPSVVFEEKPVQPAVAYQEIKHVQPVVQEVKVEHYEKPAVVVEQKPAVAFQEVKIANNYDFGQKIEVKHEQSQGYHYEKQQPIQTVVKDEGYHYEKPAVVFEEKPAVTFQAQSYQEVKHENHAYHHDKSSVVFGQKQILQPVTYEKPQVHTYVHHKQAEHKEHHAVAHQEVKNEGYYYEKPTIAFEEKPIVHVQQEIKPAVTYHQEYKPAVTVHEVKPAVTVHEVKPAVTYQEYKPAVTVHEVKPAVTYQEYKPTVTVTQPVVNYHHEVKPAVTYQHVNLKPTVIQHQQEGYYYENSAHKFNAEHKQVKFEGYHYEKPAVAFEEVTQKTIVQPVVYEQKPTYKEIVTKVSKPAIISSFSITQPAQSTQTYLPVEPVKTYIPSQPKVAPKPTLEYLPVPQPTPIVKETYLPVPKPTLEYLPAPIVKETYLPVPKPTLEYLPAPKPTPVVKETYLPVPKPTLEYLPAPKPTVTYLPAPKPSPTYIPVVKQDTIVESYFNKPVSIDYSEQEEVSEEPIVAKKTFLTYQKESGYDYPKPEIKFEEEPIKQDNFYFYDNKFGQKEDKQVLIDTVATVEEHVPVVTTSRPIVRYEFSSLDDKYNNYYENYEIKKEVYVPVTTRRPVVITTPRREYLPVTTPRREYLPVTTPKPVKPLKRVYLPVTTTERYVEVTSPSREYLPVTQQIYTIKTRPTTAKPSREYLPVTTAKISKEYLPVTTAKTISVTTEKPSREYLPVRTRTRKPSREYLPVTSEKPSREYLPVTSSKAIVEDVYVATRRPKTKVTKSKTIVKVNDFHPILSAKLGAQCTCVSNTVTLRKKAKNLNVERENYPIGYEIPDEQVIKKNYEDDYVGDNNQQNDDDDDDSVNKDSVDVVVEDFKYEPEKISTTEAVFIEEPSSEAVDIFINKGRKQSVRVIKKKKPNKEEIADAVNTGLKLVKSAVKEGVKEGVKEALATKDYDRYGPGGVRGRSETLQGTIDCQRAGLFRHPKHCNKFYACRWDCDKKKFTLHVFNCPVHLTFDNNLGACNWPSQGPACVDDTLLPSV